MLERGEWCEALSAAATSGSAAELRALLADVPPGASVDAPLELGMTAVMWVAGLAHVECCALLLQAGASLSPRGDSGFSPLCFGQNRANCTEEMFAQGTELLAAYGGRVEDAPKRFDVRMFTRHERDYERRRQAQERVNAHLKAHLGFEVAWHDDGRDGYIWITADELGSLRASFWQGDPSGSITFEAVEHLIGEETTA